MGIIGGGMTPSDHLTHSMVNNPTIHLGQMVKKYIIQLGHRNDAIFQRPSEHSNIVQNSQASYTSNTRSFRSLNDVRTQMRI